MLMIILIPVLVYALIKWFHYYCLLRGLIYFAIKEHNWTIDDEEIKKISRYAIERIVREG